MPAKAKTKKFITIEGVDGPVAVNADLITRISFVTPQVPGLLDERKYLRLCFSGAYFDSVDVEDIVEQEVSV
jgi:hypothetical protein